MSRELLQQALDALGTSTWDHTRAVGKQELITALRAALAQPEPVAHLYDDGTWIATQTAAGRSLNDRMLFAGSPKIGVYTVATPPAAPAPAVPRHVRKIGGSFQHTGTVVADFKTAAGEPRIVLEFDAPVAGMLHVYRPDQVEPCESAAPVVRELQDDLIESVIRDVAELDYSSLPDMPEVMLVTANELRGILQAHGITGGSNG